MKVWRLLVCMIACLTTAARAEALLCVSSEDCAALLSMDGNEIVSPGIYDDIYALTDDRYALGAEIDGKMRYALCDGEGQLLTDALYELLQAEGEVILFRQDGRCGAMDADGRILVEPLYTQLITAGNGTFLAMSGDPYDEEADAVLRIGTDGMVFDTLVYAAEGLEPLSDGLTPYRDPSNGRYGYLNAEGEIAVTAQFETADGFRNGLARASEAGRLGAIDVSGDWRIAPEYDYLQIGEGVITAMKGRELVVLFDGEGREILRTEGAKLEAAMAGNYPIVLEENALKVYASDGNVLMEAGRSAAVSAGLDGQLIVSDGIWGSACVSLMNSDGTAVEGAWQQLLPLNAGRYAFVRMNAAAYYSDDLSEVRYSVDLDSLRFGMMDAQGRQILPAEYLEIRALGENRYLTAAEDSLYVVDGDGNVIWPRIEEE